MCQLVWRCWNANERELKSCIKGCLFISAGSLTVIGRESSTGDPSSNSILVCHVGFYITGLEKVMYSSLIPPAMG